MAKSVHALVGSDLYLQLEALRRILAEAPPGVQRVDVDGEKVELAEVLDELRSFAMFSSAKVVVVRDADEFISRFRAELEKHVAKPTSAPSSTLVLRVRSLPANQKVAKLIAQHGQVHDCNPPRDLARWIIDQGRRSHKINVAADAARLLADLVGADLGRLDNELAKLALQVEGPAAVTVEAVRSGVSFQREQELHEMTGELADGQVVKAVERWRRLVSLDPSAEFRAVTWLGMWLEDVRSFLADPRSFKNAWKYRGRMDRFQRTAEAIGRAGVGRLIDLLTEVDHRSKSGLGEMAENVERFLLTVARAVPRLAKV